MKSGRKKQFVASTISQLSALLAGASYGWLEPIILRLEEDPELNLTVEDISWLISIIQAGVIVGSLVSGEMTNRFGRKYIIMSISPLCLVGWALVLWSKSMLSLILVRLVHGLVTGIGFTVTPIYAAEIAEPKLRGRLSGTFQTNWYLGILYATAFGPYVSYDVFAYVCLPLPIIFAIIWIFMPETPYYLLMAGQEEEARKVLKKFRDTEIEEELQDMKKAVEEEMSTKGSWKILFFDKDERKAFIIVQIVCIARYLGGMAIFVNYAMDTFSRSESFLPPAEMTILLNSLFVVISVVAAFLSDWVGRRPLLLWSCFGCFVSHFLTGAYYYIHEKTTIDSSHFTWGLYIGLFMYCFFVDIGMGPLLQTLKSEMFGASTRGIAAGFTEGLSAVLCFAVLKAYSPINEKYGIYVNFWFFSLANLIGGILLFWLLNETAGKTIGQMKDKPVNERQLVNKR